MSFFKTLVIMDLESSGLPAYGKTKITELSFVGVLVKHVLDCHKSCETLPRVVQKLSFCCYPQKLIDFEASEITGLDNFLLEEIPSFNKQACQMLSTFLERLPPPICLVAHNGMKFDFQLLKAEMFAKQEVLQEGIFCADSLLAFRALFPINYGSYPSSFSHQINSSSRSPDAVPLFVSHDAPNLSRAPSDVSPRDSSETKDHKNSIAATFLDSSSANAMQKANETTPKQAKRPALPPPLRKRSLQFDDDSVEGNNSSKKMLFRGQRKLTSHRLVDIYSFILGKAQNGGHHAENDTLALLECIVSTAPEFLTWVEKNHLNFEKIPCMW